MKQRVDDLVLIFGLTLRHPFFSFILRNVSCPLLIWSDHRDTVRNKYSQASLDAVHLQSGFQGAIQGFLSAAMGSTIEATRASELSTLHPGFSGARSATDVVRSRTPWPSSSWRWTTARVSRLATPASFELARRIAAITPGGLDHVFFTSSGSEAVDTALKNAMAYHRVRGEGQRLTFVSRERPYHGMNIGVTTPGMWLRWWSG